MLELLKKKYIVNFFLLPVFAIGSFYDKRLEIGDFNITYVFSLMFVSAMVLFFKKATSRVIRERLILILVIIVFINSINWLLWDINTYNDYSINKLITLTCITFPICFYANSFKSEKDIIVFLKQISLVGVLLGTVGFRQILSSGGGDESRLAVLGGGPIVFSRWIGFFFLVFLFNYDVKYYIKIPVLLICIVLMSFSGSKGPFFILIAIVILISLRNKKIIILLASLYAVMLFYASTLVSLISKNVILVRLFGLNDSSNITSGTSTTARLSLLSESLNSIIKNPFGYGLGNFSVYSDSAKILGNAGYPHNFMVETLLELGVVVWVIVLIVFGYLFFMTFKLLYSKKVTMSKPERTLICVWLFYFFNSLVSGDLSDARFLIVFTAIFYVLLQINKRKLSIQG